MNDFFVNLLFGHFVGDYFLQTRSMAMNKSGNTLKCMIHCLIYTLSICCFTFFDWRWAITVFCSHFFIDRFSLADLWLDFIRGRSLRNFYHFGHEDLPKKTFLMDEWPTNYRILRGGFTSIVYCVVDNVAHLMIMYYYGKMLL